MPKVDHQAIWLTVVDFKRKYPGTRLPKELKAQLARCNLKVPANAAPLSWAPAYDTAYHRAESLKALNERAKWSTDSPSSAGHLQASKINDAPKKKKGGRANLFKVKKAPKRRNPALRLR